MIMENISVILIVAGVLTGLTVLQFLFPRYYLRVFNKVAAGGELPFYARQGGLAMASVGVLLVWAALDPALRLPVIAVAVAGKAVFAVTTFLHLRKLPGLLTTAIVDSAISVVLGLYLFETLVH